MPGQLRYNNAPQPYLFDVSAAFRNAADLINTPLRHFGEVADKITTSIQNQNTNELYRYLASQYDPSNVQSINQALARAAGDNRFSNVGADTWRQATDDYRVRQSELLNKENLALAQRAMDPYQNRINQEAANGSIAGLLAANNAGAQAMLDGKVRSDAIKYGEVDPLRTSASERALRGAQAGAARANAEAARARAQATRALAARTNLENLNNDAYNWLGRRWYEQQLRNVDNPGSGQTDATTMSDLVEQAEKIFGPNITNAVHKFYQNAKNAKGNQAALLGELKDSDWLNQQTTTAMNQDELDRAQAQEILDQRARDRAANSFLMKYPANSTFSGSRRNTPTSPVRAFLDMVTETDAEDLLNNAADFMQAVARRNQNNTSGSQNNPNNAVGSYSVSDAPSMYLNAAAERRRQMQARNNGEDISTIPIQSGTQADYRTNLAMNTAAANLVSVNNSVDSLNTTGVAQGLPSKYISQTADNIQASYASANTALNNSLGTTPGAKVDAYYASERNGGADAIVKQRAAELFGVDPNDKVITSNNVIELAKAIQQTTKDGEDSYSLSQNEITDAINRGINEYGLRPLTAAMAVADAIHTQINDGQFLGFQIGDKYDLDDSDINRNFRAARSLKNVNSDQTYAVQQLYEASKQVDLNLQQSVQLQNIDIALRMLLAEAEAVGGISNLPKSKQNQIKELYRQRRQYSTQALKSANGYTTIMNRSY